MEKKALPDLGHHSAPARELARSSGAGQDDALIFWMLSLTPTEWLAVAQGFVHNLRSPQWTTLLAVRGETRLAEGADMG